jgi:hypothetical protein
MIATLLAVAALRRDDTPGAETGSADSTTNTASPHEPDFAHPTGDGTLLKCPRDVDLVDVAFVQIEVG